MSKSQRLASFGGPSTPKRNAVVSNPTSPAHPKNSLETTYHRKLRSLLLDFRSFVQTWRDVETVDGLKAAKTLIDTRTELENALTTYGYPTKPLMGNKSRIMDHKIRELDAVLSKLANQMQKMSTVVENIEVLINEAHRVKGWSWISSEPMWCSWPMEKFYLSLLVLLPDFNRSLEEHKDAVLKLRSHDLSFDQSRGILQAWTDQPSEGWDELDDMFSVEVQGW